MRKNLTTLISLGFGIFLLFIYLTSNSFITIPSGHSGVLYRKFGNGTVVDQKFQEGFHIIAPWNKMYLYNIRLQEAKEDMNVLSKNGLSIKVEVSVRYKPNAANLGTLHQKIGKNYLNTIILPELRASTRRVIGKYEPEELYSTKRAAIQSEIFGETRDSTAKKFISLDAVLIRSVELPATIKQAIETKLKQEQASKEYEFRLTKEKKEAERKRIEAKGIKDFQDIVSQGISDKLLKWKGIEATLELSKSENSKVIVIGGGEDGLPIILGDSKD